MLMFGSIERNHDSSIVSSTAPRRRHAREPEKREKALTE
jgi:hypothetical protein